MRLAKDGRPAKRAKPITTITKSKSSNASRKSFYSLPFTMRRPLAGFSRQLQMTHKYVEAIQVTASGTCAKYFFNCNSMYDPNATSTGHQPMYFDQVAALYDHYTVIQSRIKVSICIASNQAAASIVCGININDDATHTASSAAAIAEDSQSTVYAMASLPVQPLVMTAAWNVKKVFAGDPLANTELQGSATSSPTEISTYLLYFQNFAGTDTTCNVLVELHYTAVWKELKDIAQS